MDQSVVHWYIFWINYLWFIGKFFTQFALDTMAISSVYNDTLVPRYLIHKQKWCFKKPSCSPSKRIITLSLHIHATGNYYVGYV